MLAFDDEGNPVEFGGFKAKTATPSPSEITNLIIDEGVKRGLKPHAAAGIAGNFAHETGDFRYMQELRPTVPGSRGGYGWAQWTGPRRTAFFQFAKDHQLDPNSPEANLGFTFAEIDAIPGLKDRLNQAVSPDEAAVIFRQEYERPGVPADGSRVRRARRAMQDFMGASAKANDRPFNYFTDEDIATDGPTIPANATVESLTGAAPRSGLAEVPGPKGDKQPDPGVIQAGIEFLTPKNFRVMSADEFKLQPNQPAGLDLVQQPAVEDPDYADLTQETGPLRSGELEYYKQRYEVATPEQRQTLLNAAGVEGAVSRYVAKKYQAADQVAQFSPDLQAMGNRREDIRLRGKLMGMDQPSAEWYADRTGKVGPFPVGNAQDTTFNFDRRNELAKAGPVTRGVIQGVDTLKQQAAGLNKMAADLADTMGVPGAAAYGKAQEQARNRLQMRQQEMGENPNAFSRNLEGAIASTVSNAPGMVAGLLTGTELVPLLGMGAQVAGDEYANGLKSGLNHPKALARSLLYGAAEVLGEKIGFKDQLDLIKRATKGNWVEFERQFVKTLAEQVAGEEATTLAEFRTDKSKTLGLSPQATAQDLLNQMKDTLYQTVLQTALMGAPGAAGAAVQSLQAHNQAADQGVPSVFASDVQRAFTPVREVRSPSAPVTEADHIRATPLQDLIKNPDYQQVLKELAPKGQRTIETAKQAREELAQRKEADAANAPPSATPDATANPYRVEPDGERFRVVNGETGQTVASVPTEDAANQAIQDLLNADQVSSTTTEIADEGQEEGGRRQEVLTAFAAPQWGAATPNSSGVIGPATMTTPGDRFVPPIPPVPKGQGASESVAANPDTESVVPSATEAQPDPAATTWNTATRRQRAAMAKAAGLMGKLKVNGKPISQVAWEDLPEDARRALSGGQGTTAPTSQTASTQESANAAQKEPWEMTADDYAETMLESSENADAYRNDPETRAAYKDDLIREWHDKLEERARHGRISDVALDDFVARHGVADLQRTFRGVFEKGVEGYQPPSVRQQTGWTAPKRTALDKELWELTWQDVRKHRTPDHFPDSAPKTPAYWRALKDMHRKAIQKALWEKKPVTAEVLADYPDLAQPADKSGGTPPSQSQTKASAPAVAADQPDGSTTEAIGAEPTSENANAIPPADEGLFAQDNRQGEMGFEGGTPTPPPPAESPAPNPNAEDWAEIAQSHNGPYIAPVGDTALLQAFNPFGQPVFIGIKGSSYTRVDLEAFTGDLFTAAEKAALLPAKRQWLEQDAAEHAKNPDGPFHGGLQIAFSPNVPQPIQKILTRWRGLLGIQARIYVSIRDDARTANLHGPFAAVPSQTIQTTEHGSVRKLTNGDYSIVYQPDTRQTANLETLSHEFGHVLEREVYQNAPEATRQAIRAEFERWLQETQGQTARESVLSMRAHTVGRATSRTTSPELLATDMPPYWRSFSEWFADQVSRWSTTQAKPLSVVEKFFVRLGQRLRMFFTKNKSWWPNTTMTDWLNSLSPEIVEEQAKPAAKTAGAGQEGNTRDSFKVKRVEENEPVTLTFERGQTVKIAGRYPMDQGVIQGISQRNRKAKVNGVWHDFGYIYPLEYDEFAAPRADIETALAKIEARLNDGNSIDAGDMLRAVEQDIQKYGLTQYRDTVAKLREQATKVERAFLKQREAKRQAEQVKQDQATKEKAKAAAGQPAKVVRMTMDEWKQTHRDAKGKLPDGTRSILYGGALYPVEIVKDAALSSQGKPVVVENTPTPEGETRFSRRTWYFSPLAKAIEAAKQAAMPGSQWWLWVKSNQGKLGLKDDELAWTGLEDYLRLRGKDKVTKAELVEFLNQNGVQVYDKELSETRLSEDWRDTAYPKYGLYTLPGGKHYRELLLILRAEPGDLSRYRSRHWQNQNVLAHLRFDERTDAGGNRVMFITEIQSDWGQEGKKQGFRTGKEARNFSEFAAREGISESEQERLSKNRNTLEGADKALWDKWMAEGTRWATRIAPAPFVTDTKAWVALALKRSIRYAAENGFDKVAFANGQQNADLYDLSKQIDEIRYLKSTAGGSVTLVAIKDGAHVFNKNNVPMTEVEDIVGKELAHKIENDGGERDWDTGYRSLSGLDLKVGGEGMRAFYDQIVPSVANDVLKKLGGGRVETVSVLDGQPGFSITPELRAKAIAGLPLFKKGAMGGPGHTPASLRTAINTSEGKGFATALERTGWFHIITDDQVPASVRREAGGGRIPAYTTSDGHVYLVADEITPEDSIRGLLLHEVSTHALRLGRDEAEFQAILEAFKGLDSESARRARAAVPQDTPAALRDEEALAYWLEQNPNHRLTQRFIGWLKAAIRKLASNLKGADRLRFVRWARQLSDADYHYLAHTALRAAVRGQQVMTGEALARFRRAWHGGGDFDRFDASFIGTGAQTRGYGHGFYFSDVRETGAFYQKLMQAMGKPGRLYEVELAPEDDEWMDYFKPLREQSAKVQDAARALGFTDPEQTGEELYDALTRQANGAPQASQALREAGVKGIRYPAEGRQNRGKHNYVLFDPRDVAIANKFSRSQDALPETLEVDGVQRPTRNSEGRVIHPTEAGIREFWRWFKDSKVVDSQGRPLVVYHGTPDDVTTFDPEKTGGLINLTTKPETADVYASGAGGNRRMAQTYFSDTETGEVFEPQDTGGHILISNWQGSRGTVVTSEEIKEGIEAGRYESMKDGANTLALYAKANLLSLTNPEGIKVLAGLNHQNWRAAIPIIEEAKRGYFHWSATQHEYAWKVWQNVLNPQLEAQGYTGIKFKDDNYNDPFTIAVFHSTQLKSAYGNTGAFGQRPITEAEAKRFGMTAEEANAEQAKGDIRFSRRAPGNPELDAFKQRAGLRSEPRTLADRMRGLLDSLRDSEWRKAIQQGLFDSDAGIKFAEEALNQALTAEQSGWVAAKLSRSMPQAIMHVLTHGPVQYRDGVFQSLPGRGLLDILSPVQDELEDFTAWMVARRASRLINEGRERNFTGSMIDAGLALNANRPRDAQGRTDFERVAAQIRDLNYNILQFAQDAGLITREFRQILLQHGDYIPFYRVFEDSVLSPKTRKALSHQSSGIRVLKGGESPLSDPLGNLIANWAHLLDAGLKNLAMDRTLTNLDGTDFIAEVLPRERMRSKLIPNTELKKILGEIGADLSGQPQADWIDLVNNLPDSVYEGFRKLWAYETPTDPDVVRVMRGGRPVFMRVADGRLLTSLKGLQNPWRPDAVTQWLLNTSRGFARVYTRLVTSTPVFWWRNWARDSMQSWVINPHGLKLGLGSVKGIVQSLREDPEFQAMALAGGSFYGGYVNANDPKALGEMVRGLLRERGMNRTQIDAFMRMVRLHPGEWWDMYQSVGDAFENANRRAMYEATLNATGREADAAFASRDLLDFSTRGSWHAVQALTAILPFFNARLQGLYKLQRSGALPGAAVKYVLTKALMLAAASMVLAFVNAGDDDYEEIEEWEKDAFWHIKRPGTHDFFKIPKPFEIGLIFGTLPQRMVRGLMGKDDGKVLAQSLARALADTLAFNPLQPQITKPIQELLANKNEFTGRPIESFGEQFKPASQRYNANTSELAKQASRSLSRVSDTMPAWVHAPDAFGLSPKRFEHLVRGYFGAVGTFLLQMGDAALTRAMGLPAKPAMTINQTPLISSFYRANPTFSTKYQTELYDLAQSADEAWRLYQEAGTQNDRQRVLRDHPELPVRSVLSGGREQLRAIRKRMDAVILDKAMTPEEKRSAMEGLMQQRNQAARRAVESAKERMK